MIVDGGLNESTFVANSSTFVASSSPTGGLPEEVSAND